MPQPKVKQGDADKHRENNDDDSDSDSKVHVEAEKEGGAGPEGEVEVEATGGGDGDPDDPDDGQRHPNSDDDGGGSILRNKKVVALMVVAAVIGLYWLYLREQAANLPDATDRDGGGGQGNATSAAGAELERNPESVDDVVDAATHTEPDGRDMTVPIDEDDPLAADKFVLNNSNIFPSISGKTDQQNPGGDGGASAAG